MTTLPRQIAFAHCPVYDPTRGFEGCKCGAPVTGQAHQEHVVEVTEAAVREQIAADVEARRLAYLDMPRSVVAGSMAYEDAARIARGEVTP